MAETSEKVTGGGNKGGAPKPRVACRIMKASSLALLGLLLAGCTPTSTPPATTNTPRAASLTPDEVKVLIVDSNSAVMPSVTTKTPQSTPLTPNEAGALARKMANEKAQALCGAWPFWDSTPAHFDRNQWYWSDYRACGYGDMQASVRLAADGSPLSVNVMFLISRPSLD